MFIRQKKGLKGYRVESISAKGLRMQIFKDWWKISGKSDIG